MKEVKGENKKEIVKVGGELESMSVDLRRLLRVA